MVRPYFMLKSLGNDYYLECQGPGVSLADRKIVRKEKDEKNNKDDFDRFDEWIGAYRRSLPKHDPAIELLALGREIRGWLDEGGNWFSKLKVNRESSPFILEFRVATDPSDPMLRFLEIPWELLADDNGHPAADGHVLYCPVRRIGEPKMPEECSSHRLSVTFMAASPVAPVTSEAAPLRFENEERAIFQATGTLGMDLSVEESGTLRLLAETLALEPNPGVLHVSCHGNIIGGRPVLNLETDEGEQHNTNPDEFSREFGETRPRLFFASACKTGEVNDDLVNSFGSDLIRRGWPAVLGWSGSVGDADATRFAEKLYGYLSRKNSIEGSTAHARQELLSPVTGRQQTKPSKDWHLARLYLGPNGGGPVCGGETAGRMGRVDSGVKEFLDKKQQIPVAGRWEFVGRRREIQKVLKALRSGDHAGVLIHGFGRQGKSSLAARLADRMHGRHGHQTAVVFERYDDLAVLSAIAEARPVEPVIDIVARYRDSESRKPGMLERALYDILTGPCRDNSDEPGEERRPILLIVDDFESALERDKPFPHPIHPDYLETIRSVIQAFRLANGKTKSGLVFTSRHTFSLKTDGANDLAGRLFHLPLAPMENHEGLKQIEAKSRSEGVPPETLDAELTNRIVRAAQGNPGLQDILFRMYLNAKQQRDRTRETPDDSFQSLIDTLKEMEAYIATGEFPGKQELIEFLENLAVDRMLDLLGEGEKELLRASTLFQLPVPVKILEIIADRCGYDAGEPFGFRIFGLGLWGRYEDPVDRGVTAAAANPLAKARLEKLSEEDAQTLSSMIVVSLFKAWGGKDRSVRPLIASRQLSLLALLAESAEIVAHAAADAVRFLENQFLNREAAGFAADCLALLEKSQTVGTSDFYHKAGDIFQATGETGLASNCVERALALSGQIDEEDKSVENFEYASILLTHGRLKQQLGEVDEAVKILQEAERRFNAVDSKREKLIVLGDIARIKVSKGDVDDALKLHEEMLDVFDSLGDRRERAVTLGYIARIKVDKGDVDDALKLHEEMLDVFDSLGDRRSRAVTLGDIARIKVSKGDVDDALKLHEEELEVYDSLGDRRSRAVTLGYIARIKVDKGDVDDALKLHEERLDVFDSLGDRRSRAVTLGDIARIKVDKGDVDDALKLHEEMLDVFDSLGDRRSRAVTLVDIARIKVDKGDVDDALKLHEEMLDVFDSLGDRRERAVTLGDIARIKVSKGDVDDALNLHEEMLEIYKILGDLVGIANTLWSMAQVDLAKQEHRKAYERLSDSYQILLKLGRLDGICVVGLDLGQILCAGGHMEEGLEILKRSRDGFIRLGRHELARRVDQLIAGMDDRSARV